MLEVFTEHRIPNKIRCDHGSNFTSLDFASFCSDLGISLSFSSSYHHQSVPAECSVRTVKNIMKKCHETGTPWHLGLLEYLCTPLDEKTPSPSSLLGRQFKGLCPIFNHTNSSEGVLENLINRELNEKLHHDRRSHTLEDIPTGSTAAVLDHHSNTWTVGHVLDRTDRRYTVELPTGRVIHQNRVDLRPTSVEFQCKPQSNTSLSDNVQRTQDPFPVTTNTQTVTTSPKVPSPKPNVSKTVVKPTAGIAKSSATTTSNKTTTHSGRVVKPPTKLNL